MRGDFYKYLHFCKYWLRVTEMTIEATFRRALVGKKVAGVQVKRFQTPQEFLDAHASAWGADEAAHGALLRVVSNAPPDSVCVAVEDATACLVPGDQVIVSRASDAAIDALARALVAQRIDVPGIFAPAPVGRKLADRLGGAYRTVKRLLHWELTAPLPLPVGDGHARMATAADAELVAGYRDAMQEEMNTQRPANQRAAVEREIGEGDLHVWEAPDGAIASMGTIDLTRSERSGVVDAIYTPPGFRGRGYATHLTRHLCSLVLARCRVVFLASDADDPGPTRVYEKVGFTVRCEMENLRATTR